jgi:hypothetical protein
MFNRIEADLGLNFGLISNRIEADSGLNFNGIEAESGGGMGRSGTYIHTYIHTNLGMRWWAG